MKFDFISLITNKKAFYTSLVVITIMTGFVVYINLHKTEVRFNAFVEKFEKIYESNEERERRFEIFKESLKNISLLNAVSGAQFGLTKFADWSDEEIEQIMNYNREYSEKKCKPKSRSCRNYMGSYQDDNNKTIPPKFDWREQNAVGPVLSQKKCAVCWAFSIAGVIESMTVIQKKESLVQRSIQEIIDCTAPYGQACRGWNVIASLDKMCTNALPVTTADNYPLDLADETCKLDNIKDGVKIRRFTLKCKMNEDDIIRLVATHGPVMVVVNAKTWLYYTGGIIQHACFRSLDDNSIDHVVQIVGYVREGDIPHYIIKNSWGEDFGVGGYVKVAIGGNLCGIADEVTYLEVY